MVAGNLECLPKSVSALRQHCAGDTLLSLPTWYGVKTLLRAQGLTNLTALRFPNNGWKGPIGPLRYYFPALRMLDLSGNSMVSMPDLVAEFGGTLQVLDLSYNKLQGK
jgi:hypothetical protein